MEPSHPDSSNSDSEETPTKKKWGRFSRKTWALIIVGLVLAFVVGTMLLSSSGSKNEEGGQDSNVYYDRPGFDKEKLSSGIGDPAPLISKLVAAPVTYKGASVVQACSLLTVEDIRKLGLNISPNSLAAIGRVYYDGQSQIEVAVEEMRLTSDDNGNNCRYPIYQPEASVDIEVYQPSYNAPAALDYELGRRFQAAGTVEGLTQYVREGEEGRKYHILRGGDNAVQVYLREVADAQLQQRILTTIAKNFKRLLAAPDGPLQFAYDSPVFKKSYLNSCSVITAADVQAIFGISAKPVVEERLASAVGAIEFTAANDKTLYNYIDHECIRRAVGEGFRDRRSITVESSSYVTPEAAQKKIQSGKQLDDKVSQVPTRIGDEVYFSYTTGRNPEMTIRKGRFVVNLSLFDQTKPNMSDQQMVQTLTPLAQAVVSRIKDF